MTFIPSAEAIVIVPPSNDRLVVHRVNIEELLAASTRDFLFAASLPPTNVAPGTLFEYRMDVKTRRGKASFRLETKPDGMEISPEGVIRWTAPASFANKQSVVVRLSDGMGAETSQSFEIEPSVAEQQVQRNRSIVKLESSLQRVIAAGAGRYLIGFLDRKKKIVVVDVVERRVAHELSVEEVPLIVGTADKFVVYLPTQKLLSRYDLKTGEREQTVPFENEAQIATLAAGADSQGPLVAVLLPKDGPGHAASSFAFIDLTTLRLRKMTFAESQRGFPLAATWHASANGRSFVGIESSIVMRLDGDVATTTRIDEMSQIDWEPSADGEILIGPYGSFSRQGDQLGKFELQPNLDRAVSVPAMRGPLTSMHYIRSSNDREFGKLPVEIFTPGISRPILSLHDIDALVADGPHETPPLRQRFFFAPHLSVIVTIPDKFDSMIVHDFDFERELSQRKEAYLFVASPPPSEIALENPSWSHQLDLRSNRGEIKCSLVSGPEGLTVSPTGLLTWPKPIAGEKFQSVVVAIRDTSGKELLYNFRLRVARPPAIAGPLGQVRKWTSSDGLFSVSATFVEVRKGKVVLKLADGKFLEVPLDKLSEADRMFLKKERGQ
ncbi:MAG: hypothetical protein K8U03_05530 [Planctomycetia bacterium]|nr:hypothetical protein [Planctomycetia bacterium]